MKNKMRLKRFIRRTSDFFVATLPNTAEGQRVFKQLAASTPQRLVKIYRGGKYTRSSFHGGTNGWARKIDATRFDVYFKNREA